MVLADESTHRRDLWCLAGRSISLQDLRCAAGQHDHHSLQSTRRAGARGMAHWSGLRDGPHHALSERSEYRLRIVQRTIWRDEFEDGPGEKLLGRWSIVVRQSC